MRITSSNVESPRLVIYGWFVCLLAALFYCYEYLLRIEPSVMAMPLRMYFHLSAAQFGGLIANYYYAYAPMQLVVGILCDYFGARRALIFAIALCSLGSILFASTGHVWVAAIGRFIIGVGSAFAFVGALKIASIWLPRRYFAMFAGFATSLGMVGAIAGDVTMTRLVQLYGWQTVIMDSAIIGAILIPLFLIFVKDHLPGEKPQHNIKIEFIQWIKELLLAVRNINLFLAGFIGCLCYFSLSLFAELWGIPFLKLVNHGNSMHAAEINSMIFWGWLVGAPLAGWLSAKFRTRRKLLLIGALLAAVIITPAVIWPGMPTQLLSVFLFLYALCCSVEVTCFAIARDVVSHRFVATAVCVINLVIMLSGVVMQPLFGWLLELNWNGKTLHGVPVYSLHDYQHALYALPVAMLVAAVIAFFMRETHPARVQAK